MPLRSAPSLPSTLYAEVTNVRDDSIAFLVLLRPGDGLTDDAILDVAHKFIAGGARLADRSGRVVGDLVQSGLAPPGGVNWHGLPVPEGTWVVAVRLADAAMAHVFKSNRRLTLHPVVETAKGGEDDVDERTFSRVLAAAMRPVSEALAAVEVRLKRLEQRVRPDPFGDAVRGRGDAGVRELQRLKQRQREVDPVGSAISERRLPLFDSHPTLDALGRARDPEEAPPPPDTSDPFGDAVTRKRPPLRRPLGVAAPPKRSGGR